MAAPDAAASGMVLLLGCSLLFSAPRPAASAAPTTDPADAVAFIRSYGDVKIEVTDDWEGPEVFENVEVTNGSGFVVAPSGLILTNHHVVAGGSVTRVVYGVDLEVSVEITRVEVAVGGGGEYGTFEAYIVANNPELDLAILQITATELPYIALGDSDAVETGQRVRVVGFPFGRDVEVGRQPTSDVVPDPSVTAGTVSAARSDEEGERRYLQTDASMYPGSSGGAMVDEDGYAIGVVRMKLAEGRHAEGAGFGVPINLVKDLLEANGLLFQVPGTPLGAGVVHDLDWKGIRIELPEGQFDRSRGRLQVDTGGEGEAISLIARRLSTPASLRELERALLRARIVRGFVPAEAGEPRRAGRGVPGRLVGSAQGTGEDGRLFRVEYALLKVGETGEKVVARFLGSPDDIAFNLSLLRRSLNGMEAIALLTDEVRSPVEATFERVSFGQPTASVLLPGGWSREPATRAACTRVPRAEAGVATAPPGDFTVVLRVLRWSASEIRPEAMAQACGQPPGTPALAYARRQRRLGVAIGVWGSFQKRGGEVLLLEAEAPEAKLAFVRDLYVKWLQRVAE